MRNRWYEWDDQKAARNLLTHGVSFHEATNVFKDAFAIDFVDDRFDYGEERSIMIGVSSDTILVVVYTEREESKRIISARQALKNERDNYYRQNLGG